LSEIERIEQWNAEEMAKGYSDKDINYSKAGFDEVANEFGYFYSLHNISKGDATKYKAILSETVGAIYKTTHVSNRNNKCERLYHNLKQGKL